MVLIGDRVERLLGVGRTQRLGAIQRPEVTVDPRHRRRVRLDVEIGSLPLDDVGERLVDVEAHPSPYRVKGAHPLAAFWVCPRTRRQAHPTSPGGYATSRSFWASASDCSFFSDWFSICRIRSRVTLKVRPTSSSVRGCSPPSP